MKANKHLRGWLWSDKGLTTRNKVRCVQASSSTLPTMINKTQGCRDLDEKKCYECRKEIEDNQNNSLHVRDE